MKANAELGFEVTIDLRVTRQDCEADGTTLDAAWDALVAAGYDPADMDRTDDEIFVLSITKPAVFMGGATDG